MTNGRTERSEARAAARALPQRDDAAMVTYAIGDIQGCEHTFVRLLERLRAAGDFDPARDRLWLVGDLVNRGPRSLAVLRRVHALAQPGALGERLTCVLGNHDLHLLACAANVARPRRGDTLDAVLAAPDRETLLEWLRHQPLLHTAAIGGSGSGLRPHVLVHAGLPPGWTVEAAAARARELEAALSGPDWRDAAAAIKSEAPDRWDDHLEGAPRLSAISAGLTRLRTCHADGRLCLDFKGPPAEAPPGCRPWFDVPERLSAGATVVCGHWAALGLVLRDDLLALDSGCAWGGALTAVRLEDGAVFSEKNAEGG